MMIPILLALMVCGVLNWGYAYLAVFLLIPVGYAMMKRRDMLLNFLLSPGFWLLAAFGISYVAVAGFGFVDVQCYILLPLMAYIIGWCSFEQGGSCPETVRDCILGIAIGFAAHSCLNYFVNTGHSRYQLIDFWSGAAWSATGAGFLNTMLFSLPVYGLFMEKRKLVKMTMLSMTILCMLYQFLLGTRTQMVIFLLVPGISALLELTQRGDWKLAVKLLAAATVIALGVWMCWRFDFLNFREFVEQSNLVARFAEKEGLRYSNQERLAQFAEGLRNLYEYPLGGLKQRFYYHNLWLDISRVSGLIPMVLMLVYHGLTLFHAIQLFRNRWLDAGARNVIFCVYVGVLMNCFVEPVMEGLLSLFLAFCVINGLTDSFYYATKRCKRCSKRTEN